MDSLCEYCEYGNRYIDLGQCPECHTGKVIGDLYTREIFCSNHHKITSFAVDFSCTKKCEYEMLYKEYDIYIISKLSKEKMYVVSEYMDMTLTHIYTIIKNKLPLIKKVTFYNILEICEFLYDNSIPFRIEPEFSLLSKFKKCFPVLLKENKWLSEYMK
ncbi:hypothetical protein [uncultured Ruminococcus sp.]|uniref:hypothetical protein n=1 Tax=uncultured Ruminococcus sp. TaxID=165186 RepID=UPI0025E4A4A3|nr:hypothetical protein [uncultured Ruminococcus sp.]